MPVEDIVYRGDSIWAFLQAGSYEGTICSDFKRWSSGLPITILI